MELMIVVALIGIISSIAMPGFSHMINRIKVREAVEDTMLVLAFAYSEAIKRGDLGTVILDMADTDFPNAWVVKDMAQPATPDPVTLVPQNQLMLIERSPRVRFNITGSTTQALPGGGAQYTGVAFNSLGWASNPIKIGICTQAPQKGVGTSIQLSPIGRAAVSATKENC